MASPLQTLQRLLHKLVTSIQRSFSETRRLIRQHKTAFVGLQLAHHALVLSAMTAATLYPSLHAGALARVDRQLNATPGGETIVSAYGHTGKPNFLRATLLTFAVNLSVGAFGTVTLPGLLLPLSGIAIQAYRAVEWGLIFAPFADPPALSLPHSITLLAEGQAYVLAALASWIHTKPLIESLRSRRSGTEGKEEGENAGALWPRYKEGLKDTWKFYGPIATILAASAVWEACEVIHLCPEVRRAAVSSPRSG